MTSIDDTNKPLKRGRPSVDSEPINLRLSREMIDAIDNFRRTERDTPSRPEAVRRILSTALAVHEIEFKVDIGRRLKAYYDDIRTDPEDFNPERFEALMDALDAAEAQSAKSRKP